MVENTGNTRSWWVVPLVAFIAGLLIGWWAIGWGVWPVEWRNALPTDLRPAERNAYLQMTAESFAQNKDLRLAQERLVGWPTDELAKNLATLQNSLAGANLQGAAQVQSLTTALGIQSAQPAAPAAKPTAKPTAGAPAAAPTDLLTQLRRICTVGLWVLLFLGGVAAAVVLYRRWQAAQAAQGGPAIDEALLRERPVERSAQTMVDARRPGATVRREEPQQPLPAIEWPQAEEVEPEPPFLPPEEVVRPPQARPPAYRPAATGVTPPAVRPAEPPSRPPVAAAAGQFIKVGEFRANYQMDESDYDQAFDINDVGGAHIGQCGLALNDPIGKGRDLAAAFQAWLWDANDPDTQVKVLMSEGAYRDVGLRDQLAGAEQHPIIQARPGVDFELQTHKLLLRGTVERMDYAAAEPPNGVFAELAVRMIVYKKA